MLEKGFNLQIIGNRIYHTKSRFNAKSGDGEDYTVGVYSVKLNGIGNRVICMCKIFCDLKGTHLLMITFAKEEVFVRENPCKNMNIWLGAKDR